MAPVVRPLEPSTRTRPSTPPSPHGDGVCLVLELAARDPLPRFDPTMSVREAVLSPWLEKTYSRLIYKYRFIVGPCYFTSLAFRVVSIYASASIGRVLAPISPVIQFIATTNIMLLWRVEYVRLLLRTFEFWYFLLLNTIWMAAFGILLHDARVWLLPFMCVEFQNMTLTDAYFKGHDSVVMVGVVTIAQLLMLIAAVMLGLIDQASHVTLFETSYRKLTTREVILYTTNAVIFLIARIVYRRRIAAKANRRKRRSAKTTRTAIVDTQQQQQPLPLVRTVRSNVYRCKLVVVEKPMESLNSELAGPLDATAPVSLEPTLASGVEPSAYISMLLVPSKPILYRVPRGAWRRWYTTSSGQVVVLATALVSLVATSASFKAPSPSHIDPTDPTTVAWVALAATLVFLAHFTPYYSTQLLWRWWSSFDAVLLCFKLTLAHIGACDMFCWQLDCCLPILCSWLWWQWVVTLDALPPVSKRRLAVRLRWCVLPVLLLSLTTQLLLFGELLFWNLWQLRDRELIRVRVYHEELVFMVAPFLLSRLVAVFLWTWRLVYRVATSQSDAELLLFSGAVECEIPVKKKTNPVLTVEPSQPAPTTHIET